MYCSNCGSKLNDGSKFCQSCGTAIAQENTPQQAMDENPYAAVATTPESQPQQNLNVQPYAQAPAPKTQNFPNTPQPQYMRSVNTPQGTQYVPVAPVTSFVNPQVPPKYNVFTFITAGIMATMMLMFFLPWLTAGYASYNIFTILTENDSLIRYDVDALGICSVLMIVAAGMLIPGLILALTKKNQMPVGFAIAASAITLVALFFFAILMADSAYDAYATAIPMFMFVLSVANIVFAVLARKK